MRTRCGMHAVGCQLNMRLTGWANLLCALVLAKFRDSTTDSCSCQGWIDLCICAVTIVERFFDNHMRCESKHGHKEDEQHIFRRMRKLGDSDESQNRPWRKEPI